MKDFNKFKLEDIPISEPKDDEVLVKIVSCVFCATDYKAIKGIRKNRLFLVYTRRGLNNDHVFRHRAPLIMAEFDEENLCLIKESEMIIVPERGARLGNFGVTPVSDSESWVIVSEWMQGIQGGNNTFFISKLTT